MFENALLDNMWPPTGVGLRASNYPESKIFEKQKIADKDHP